MKDEPKQVAYLYIRVDKLLDYRCAGRPFGEYHSSSAALGWQHPQPSNHISAIGQQHMYTADAKTLFLSVIQMNQDKWQGRKQ